MDTTDERDDLSEQEAAHRLVAQGQGFPYWAHELIDLEPPVPPLRPWLLPYYVPPQQNQHQAPAPRSTTGGTTQAPPPQWAEPSRQWRDHEHAQGGSRRAHLAPAPFPFHDPSRPGAEPGSTGTAPPYDQAEAEQNLRAHLVHYMTPAWDLPRQQHTWATAELMEQHIREMQAEEAQRIQRAAEAARVSLQRVDINSLDPSDRMCVICYNDFGTPTPEGINEVPLRLPKCKHIFGDHCIKRWLSESYMCPYCRSPLLSPPRSTIEASHGRRPLGRRTLPIPGSASTNDQRHPGGDLVDVVADMRRGPNRRVASEDTGVRRHRTRVRRRQSPYPDNSGIAGPHGPREGGPEAPAEANRGSAMGSPASASTFVPTAVPAYLNYCVSRFVGGMAADTSQENQHTSHTPAPGSSSRRPRSTTASIPIAGGRGREVSPWQLPTHGLPPYGFPPQRLPPYGHMGMDVASGGGEAAAHDRVLPLANMPSPMPFFGPGQPPPGIPLGYLGLQFQTPSSSAAPASNATTTMTGWGPFGRMPPTEFFPQGHQGQGG